MTQSTELKVNKPKGPSDDALILLGREKKAEGRGSEGRREPQPKGTGQEVGTGSKSSKPV